MKQDDLSADYSELTEWELKVLDDWLAYYTKVRPTYIYFRSGISFLPEHFPLLSSIRANSSAMTLSDMCRMAHRSLKCKGILRRWLRDTVSEKLVIRESEQCRTNGTISYAYIV